jgi:CRP-like cAMP-binding protein
METIGQILAKHPFFAEFQPEHVELVAGCARNCRFNAGEYLMREGDPADRFYLIRHGMVSLEVTTPGRPPVVVTTLREGEIVGASWLVPPYRSMFDARATELTRAIGINCTCLRAKCDADHDFGYEMMKGFLPVLTQRLQATRLQILDVYGEK